MRVLFTPHPMVSHWYQMVGLAWACQVAGHDVRVVAQPQILELVARAGMTGVAVGGGFDVAAAGAESAAAGNALMRELRADPDAGPQRRDEVLGRIIASRLLPFVGAAEDVAGDLVEFAESWRPDLVIGDPLVYAAPLAAATVGAPYVRYLVDMDWAYRTAMPGNGVSAADNPRARWPERLAALYARYDVATSDCLAVRTVDICPPSLQFPGVPRPLPMRFVPYNGSGEIPDWLAGPAPRPRVCVTWGTTTTATAGAASFRVPRVIEALACGDVEVVVTLTAADRSMLSGIPPNVRVVEQLPLSSLLPTCDAIVHQGGGGAMLTAAAFGVPQVMITGLSYNRGPGEAAARSGAAVAVDWDDATPAAIAAAVESVFADGARQAAHRLRDEIQARPPAAAVVAELDELRKA